MAKKKEMNRTAGVAGRKLGRSEAIGFKLKAGMPLTGSASGVKSITTKEAGEALTQGIVTLDKKGLKFAPEGLAMALPVGKVLKAAKVFRAAGNIGKADALTARVVAKAAGGSRAAVRGQREQKVIAFMRPEWPGIFNGSTTLGALKGSTGVRSAGTKARGISESVFPRAPKKGALGDLEAGALPGSNMTNVQARRLAASRAADRAGNYTPVRELEKRLSLPAAGSVEMVKKTAKQFGQKVSGKEAKNISRLLRGRDR